MVFSEIYSRYFHVVAAILKEASDTPITEKRICEIVSEGGFAESMITIPGALKDGKWPLLDLNGKSILTKRPYMPLTLLQKRWLKALLLDPRISLFMSNERKTDQTVEQSILDELQEITPLFTPDMFVYFDQYQDGDPYDDPKYQEHFHKILAALKEKRAIQIRYQGKKGKERIIRCRISNLEYSLKDDKFRIIAATSQFPVLTINMSTIVECKDSAQVQEQATHDPIYKKKQLELLLEDERNALERAMLHFSHFEKVTEKVDDTHYRFLIQYVAEDETELLIRVLSFGPLLRVVGPEAMIHQIKNRLLKQKSCGR